MSTQLTPIAAPVVPERFANPLRQIASLLQQPAVRRSLPMILMIGLIASAAVAWMLLATPQQKVLFAGLPDADKSAVTAALQQANITARIDDGTGALTVNEDDYARARIVLAGQGLPKAAPGGYAILDQLPMGVSRAVEGERLRQARETELARSIEEIDSVAEARVHLAMPEVSVFVRDNAAPSASVILKLQAGRSLAEAQVSSIINLVASSVPGMKPDAVTIVDQMGALLTHAPGQDSTTLAGDARIDFQRRIEDKYRTQLIQLLTPLVGAGNFSAEIQADVNLDETQATRESYDKQGALRAEQGNWSGLKDPPIPSGIPGALSNTPPAASTVSTVPKTPAPAAPAAAVPGTTPAPATPAEVVKQAENYARAYDLGKEISVTRAMPGQIKRLSVAVLLRDPEKGKPRSPAEIQQITQLVRAAVGFDASRNDQVTVIARKFATASVLDDKAPWYEAGWLPIVARNVTAILIAIMVLMLGVRPLSRALLKKREEAVPPRLGMGSATEGAGNAGDGAAAESAEQPRPAVSIEMLDQARGYDDRIGMVRGFTRDNPTRAALAVRDMIKADAG
ncbi:MAG: flagellar M-ring protein FliF [Sphingomonas sp. 28-66-16]|nr:MAG: flagellar M-ring protein FliF [Sphingomonas sp. 28-66-16]